jgi:hypothetical protein
MNFTKNRLFVAIMALGLPVASLAQSSVVVPPPVAPGMQAKAPIQIAAPAAARIATPVAVPVAAPVSASVQGYPVGNTVASNSAGASGGTSAQAPAVLPPTSAGSINPAAAQGASAPVNAPPLIDIALPNAPKPDAATVGGDLKPLAPGHVPAKKAAKSKKAEKSKDDGDTTVVKAVADPYSGIVGTPVSDSQLNRFVFPEAVEGVFFQEGAPLPDCSDKATDMDPCHPVFLNGKRMMLLQLRAGAKGPVQMLVHMKSGAMKTMNLMPAAGPGAVVRVDGAEDGPSDTRLAEAKSSKGVSANNGSGMTGSEQDVQTLSRFAAGDIPAGFAPVDVDSTPVHFELFDVSQQASWEDGAGLRAHLFLVKAHGKTPVAISPSLFRQDNVKALALDRDTITNTEPAYLYMLEAVPTENN